MPRPPIPSWFFVVVVARLSHRYLLVQERKHGQTWYLPAGRVEAGETLSQAAVRETLEEAGIPVVIESLLRLEYAARPEGTVRARVVFAARPAGDAPPKSVADDESLGARWFTLEEARALDLRGHDVIEYIEQLERGGPVLPVRWLEESH